MRGNSSCFSLGKPQCSQATGNLTARLGECKTLVVHKGNKSSRSWGTTFYAYWCWQVRIRVGSLGVTSNGLGCRYSTASGRSDITVDIVMKSTAYMPVLDYASTILC
ncbi:hypothetical protein VTO42DRAFT_4617 [Malbranchea cinnamomea]